MRPVFFCLWKRILIITLFMLYISIVCTNTSAFTVTVDKSVYEPSETIPVTITLHNTQSQTTTWTVICSLICLDDTWYPTLLSQPVTLQPLETKTLGFNLSISSSMPSGAYELRAATYDTSQNELDRGFTTLSIHNTTPLLDATAMTYKDSSCTQPEALFFTDDSIHIHIHCNPSDVHVDGVVNTGEHLTFTNNYAIIPPCDPGDYQVTLHVSKEGYQNTTETLHFAVMEPDTIQIEEASPDNTDQPGTPGFELIAVVVALIPYYLWRKKQ